MSGNRIRVLASSITRNSSRKVCGFFRTCFKKCFSGWRRLMKWQPEKDSTGVRIFNTLPGFRQSARVGLHILTRAFWLLVVAACIAIVWLIVKEGIDRTMGHPLVVNVETEEVNIGDVYFPAITITTRDGMTLTSLKDAKTLFYERKNGNSISVVDGSHWSRYSVEIMLLAMDHICSVLTTFAWKHELADRADHTTNFGNNMVLSEEVRDNTSDPGMAGKVIPFIKKGMINCSEILAGCFLDGEPVNCATLFRQHLTEWGTACIFNGIPSESTRSFKTLQSVVSNSHSQWEVDHWKKVNWDDEIKLIVPPEGNLSIPWRQNAPGRTSGLSFIIKRATKERSCTHSDGTGFMLDVHRPSDEPQIKRFGHSIPFGGDISISVLPEILLADAEIKNVAMNGRKCFFSDEAADAGLKFYNTYSRQNCLSECISNEIYKTCNCSMLDTPGERGRTLCRIRQIECANKKESALYKKGLKKSCFNCLPNCRDTKYKTAISGSPLEENRFMMYKIKYGWDYDMESMDDLSVVHIFYGTDTVPATRRSKRYGIFDQIGLFGGSISMITGLTLLDVVEFCTVVLEVCSVIVGMFITTKLLGDGGCFARMRRNLFAPRIAPIGRRFSPVLFNDIPLFQVQPRHAPPQVMEDLAEFIAF